MVKASQAWICEAENIFMETEERTFFNGLKVVEFASVLAGPAAGMFFSELGATVIKIENSSTGGDVTRSWKNPLEDPAAPVSAYWSSINWGKQHVFLDLNNEGDRLSARMFVSDADVVISNIKPSSARRMGIDSDTLCAENPRLIFAQLNSWADPEDESPAFDAVLQAEAGFMYMNGEPDREPVKMPVALIDILAAHQLKEGVLVALLKREKTGRGSVVTASLMESAIASLANQASNYLMTGFIPRRMGTRHPNIAPYGDVYTTSDEKSVLVATGSERQFRNLCACLGLHELPEHEMYNTNSVRVKNRECLNGLIQKVVAEHELDELMLLFRKYGVPSARIRDMKQVFELPGADRLILEETTEEGVPTRRVKTVVFNIKSSQNC
jgi:crotonobetainyl-CoA:carnitine CoA-transferase CaiB-like acyl-CoA transferase